MRKVLFKKWIPAEYVPIEGIVKGKGIAKGTNCWESDFTHEGVFYQWASAYEEFENGAGNYTVALIETPDGTIESVLPSNIKFIS